MTIPTSTSRAEPSDDRLARRNVGVLVAAQSLGAASPPIVISLGGLIGLNLAPAPSLATLPVSMLNIGIAAAVIPAAWLMRTHGRRGGYIVGCGIGVLAGLVAAAGTVLQAFWLFCVGTFMAGLYGAFVQSYRFAATDSASEAYRPRAISLVMLGGLVAAVIGPQTVVWTRDLTPATPFAATFLAQAALALMAMGVVMALRAPPPAPIAQNGGRPLGEIMRQPRFITAVATALVSYGLMAFLMTAAPMAMVACGHSVADAALGIQWHVLAMFGPSFFTGRLITRFGKEAITGLGLVLIALSAAIGLMGLSVAHFWVALVLLGVGWNFGFIGATALVTDCHTPAERARVQAANDFLVFGAVAVASLSSGKLLSLGGWDVVNWIVFPACALALAMLFSQVRRNALARLA